MKDMLLARLKNPQDRAAIMTARSVMLGARFGIIKLAFGVYLPSVWFMINATYYLLPSSARGHAVAKYARYDKEFVIYRRCHSWAHHNSA